MNKLAFTLLMAASGLIVAGAWRLLPAAGFIVAGVLVGVVGVLSLDVGKKADQ